MDSKKNKQVTRRRFMQDSTIAAAGLAMGLGAAGCQNRKLADKKTIEKIRSYNPDMEYRRLGKTGLWLSAVCLGGHWKRINHMIGVTGNIDPYGDSWESNNPPQKYFARFHQNRYDVVSRCIEVGINGIDACTPAEIDTYAKALKGRRDKMYLACSWSLPEIAVFKYCDAKKLMEVLDAGLQKAKLDYIDIWRITALEKEGDKRKPYTDAQTAAMMEALDIAKRQGKCRFTGVSSHNRKWLKANIEKYPDQLEVAVFPYTAQSKTLTDNSLFEAIKKYDIGVLGIKPFGGNSLFKGDSSPNSPHAREDDRRARMAIRNILHNPAITAPIPGLVNIAQVDNMVKAIRQRRELNTAEKAQLEKASRDMWASLPDDYQWLKDWEYV